MPRYHIAENSKDIFAGIAILVLCSLVSMHFPILGFLCFLLLPLPVLFYRLKLGRKAVSVIALAALCIVTIIIGGGTADIWLIFGMLGLGFGLGDFLERRFSIEKTVAYACGLVLIAGFVVLMIMGNVWAANPWQLVSAYIRKNLELTAMLYKELDVPDENVQLLTQSLDQVHYVITRIMPALIAAGLIFSAWMNLLLARVVLRFHRMPEPAFGRLNRWQAPDNLVWAVIGCALVAMMPVGPIRFIGFNGLIVLMLIYLFQGLAVISFYFESKRVPMLLRILIYTFIVIQQLFALIVIGIGFFDTWANFRRLGTNPDNDAGTL